MKFKEGDRVIIGGLPSWVNNVGVITQRWDRYESTDKFPRYNVLLDDPEYRSSMFYEPELRLDILGEIVK